MSGIQPHIEVKEGLEITIKALRWDAGWEFDCPTAVISPVFRAWEDGSHFDNAIEDMLIDAVIDGKLKSQDISFWERGRGWSMAYLKRKFYRRNTERHTVKIKFVLDEDGQLSWKEISTDAEQKGTE